MSNRSRQLSRGDQRRNERLATLRSVVTRETAVLAVDLAADKQVFALCDPDSAVLARRTVRARAWELAPAVEWGISQATAAGFSSVVVACEPTGHRWRVLDQVTASLGVPLLCVQPMLVGRARVAEDLTRNKNDEADAVVIARLVTELRCYLPERADPAWARLRHLGARRARLVTERGAARQQVRDLLECAWPAALSAAAQPLDSMSWLAAVTVALDHIGTSGDLHAVRSLGWSRFAAATSKVLPRFGTTRRYTPVVRAVFDAATQPSLAALGVEDQRAGALERAAFCLADLVRLRGELADVEDRICALTDELGLSHLIGSIPGISVLGAALILAETGDPTRFGSARALVKHAGLCPRANESGRSAGTTTISGKGRPGLRLAAWRAVFSALQHNPVLAARYTHLTSRADRPLTDTQARVALCAALLRQLHAVVTTATPWSAARASGAGRSGEGAARAA